MISVDFTASAQHSVGMHGLRNWHYSANEWAQDVLKAVEEGKPVSERTVALARKQLGICEETETAMTELKLEWTQGEWEAPDGKKVPYYEADLMPLFEQDMIDLYTPGAIVYGLNIRRWPRNTTVKLVIDNSPDGVDDYTLGGDGDGMVSGYTNLVMHTLLTVSTAEFDTNPAAILMRVRDELKALGYGGIS